MRHKLIKDICTRYNQSREPLPTVIPTHSRYGAVRLEAITDQAVRVQTQGHGVVAVLARVRTGQVYPVRRGPRW